MNAQQEDRITHYVNLLRDASLKETAEICTMATCDQHLFVFSEILHTPKVAALQGTSNEKYHRLLRLFAHGVISDYNENLANLPALNDVQMHKLRMLTLVSLANGRSTLPYTQIQDSLSLDIGNAAVEQVSRDAIAAGLLRARMDQRAQVVEVSMAVGRDVIFPDGVRNMANLLQTWLTRTEQLVEVMDDRINFIGEQTAEAAKHSALAAENAAAIRKKLSSRSGREQNSLTNDIDDHPITERQTPLNRHYSACRSTRSRFET